MCFTETGAAMQFASFNIILLLGYDYYWAMHHLTSHYYYYYSPHYYSNC